MKSTIPVVSENIRGAKARNAVFAGFTDGVLVHISSFSLRGSGNNNLAQFDVAAFIALGYFRRSGDVVSHDSPSFFFVVSAALPLGGSAEQRRKSRRAFHEHSDRKTRLALLRPESAWSCDSVYTRL